MTLVATGIATGVGPVTDCHPILHLGLDFEAGAMLFVISDEIIPETHAKD